MVVPVRTSLRPLPPPPSPSRSLQGLERAIPPTSHSPKTSNTASLPDTNKPLPSEPRRSSSTYSDDSGYTKIIESYEDSDHDEVESPLDRDLLQPVAYRETISALLNRRLGEPRSPTTVPSILSLERGSAISTISSPVSFPSSVYPEPFREDCDIAPHETTSTKSNSTSHGISPLPINPPKELRTPLTETAGPRTVSKGRVRPRDVEFRAVSYGTAEKYLPGPLSPRITDVVDPSMVPEPLSIPKQGEEERPNSRFSRTSSSESSVVFYQGMKESIKGYLHEKRKRRKKNAERRERDQVLSTASAKYPHMRLSSDKKYSNSVSRRGSFQQGLDHIRDRIRNFSLSGSSDHSDEVKDSRRRSKQHAVPLSPYQKYGPSIWDSPKRRRKEKQRIREERQRAMLGQANKSAGGSKRTSLAESKHKDTPPPLISSFHSGQKQLVSVLDETKQRLKMADSDKRREALKKSIRMIGPADQFPDGRVNYWI